MTASEEVAAVALERSPALSVVCGVPDGASRFFG
jgi:hypothetical protein